MISRNLPLTLIIVHDQLRLSDSSEKKGTQRVFFDAQFIHFSPKNRRFALPGRARPDEMLGSGEPSHENRNIEILFPYVLQVSGRLVIREISTTRVIDFFDVRQLETTCAGRFVVTSEGA
jgi:hypothetical protein